MEHIDHAKKQIIEAITPRTGEISTDDMELSINEDNIINIDANKSEIEILNQKMDQIIESITPRKEKILIETDNMAAPSHHTGIISFISVGFNQL